MGSRGIFVCCGGARGRPYARKIAEGEARSDQARDGLVDPRHLTTVIERAFPRRFPRVIAPTSHPHEEPQALMSSAQVSDSAQQNPSAVVSRPVAHDEERRVGLLVLCVLALGIGVATGIGAVALR